MKFKTSKAESIAAQIATATEKCMYIMFYLIYYLKDDRKF